MIEPAPLLIWDFEAEDIVGCSGAWTSKGSCGLGCMVGEGESVFERE